MKAISKYVAYILKIGTLFWTIGLVACVLIQIYSRFLMESAPPWTEEASRVCFIYAISFAAGLAYKQNYFVTLDLITSRLSNRQNRALDIGINSVILLFFVIFTVYAVAFVLLGSDEKSPSLGLTMSYSFFSIFIMGLSISFFAFEKILLFSKMKY